LDVGFLLIASKVQVALYHWFLQIPDF
jgi:hypothetical protein